MNTENEKSLFAVVAEAKDYDKALILRGLTFSRLVDEVLVPFENKQTIWVDGYPLTQDKIRRIKIVRQKTDFDPEMNSLHQQLNWGDTPRRKMYGDQYQIRVEAIFAQHTEEVTSQVFRAFEIEIKPSLKNYLPKREELISAASVLFAETMKVLTK